MRKTLDLGRRLLTGGFSLVAALVLAGSIFSAAAFVSHAESQGKITAASVNIRKEPSTTSQVVASTERDKVVSIVSQEQGADGMIWYKVYVDANTMGYIRSDLLTITDGSTPPTATSNPGTPASTEEPPSGENPGDVQAPPEVTEVNPVSATVIGDSVKILDNTSTSAQELAQVQNGTALTVSGQATDASGVLWYKVSFISNEAQIDGFVQSVYVTLSEDLTPATGEPPQQSDPVEPTAPPEPPKQYETIYENGQWLVYNVDKPQNGYSIEQLLSGVEENGKLYEESLKDIKNQKLIIIILVFLLVAAVAGIAFLVFKIRDMMDSAYFNEVENETLRKKNAGGSTGGQRVMHTVGTERQASKASGTRQQSTGQEQRQSGGTQGQRTVGTSQRPAGSRAAGVQGQRPTGNTQGQKSVGGGQAPRPEGAAQSQRQPVSAQGQRTGSVQSQRTAGTAQGQRPVSAPQRQAGAGTSQSQRPAGAPQGAKPVQSGGPKAQPKNFMADEEEFEFEFLNYDGDDEK